MVTYIGVLLLFTSIGLGVPGIFIYAFIVDIINWFSNRKTRTTKPKRKIFKKKQKSKLKLGDKIFGLFILIAICILPIWSLRMVTPYWLDVPSIITKDYGVEEGSVTVYAAKPTSRKTWGYDSINVNGNYYEIVDDNKVKSGMNVKIKYLPHTKLIMKLWYE
ncbi:hypothetical protein LL037_11515 [Clostridium estertheticum]|uniref:hypothetical protein n=1 Tax=Clostridium estertheticum TaxID=238834 RepID=UPI001C0CCB1E|nr:hypothetical protein [Clostridium estertheticum]MBU3202057.1 hypothetical protein [Clostridium estertheticum]WAG67721.1 hypothetical protein LL037_11515 [Clostridium estertheticum]